MRYPRTFIIGIAFAVTAPLAACGDGQASTVVTPGTSTTAPSSSTSAPAGKATTGPAKDKAKDQAKDQAKPKAPATSNLSELKGTGIKSGKSVLIDVADDGADLFLEVGKGGRVDFTGTTRTDDTMMSLHPAAVSAKNRVVIMPPFYNEDLGAGLCVADVKDGPMKLETCKAGQESQIWRVAPAGDSGQFELHGAYGVIRVDGRTGLQVLTFAAG